jgi:hypothetical protein
MTVKNEKIKKGALNILTFCVSLFIFQFFIFNFAYAASFSAVVNNIVRLISDAVSVMFGLAVFFTAYAVFKYLIAGAESTKKGEAVKMITWGVIGVFVMVSVWGIVSVVKNSFF